MINAHWPFNNPASRWTMQALLTTIFFVFTHIEILSSSSIDLDNLILFGKNNGDILLPPGDDYESSGKIDITTPFPFFGQNFTSLYVTINGLISFQKLFVSFKPKPFPLRGRAIIAPFWADVDTTKGGAIWYRQNTTTHLLEVASLDVRKAFPDFQRFSAIWMFVATWEKVPFFENKNENITNTFQTALLTDGRHSFVRFNYHNIKWTSAKSSGGNPNSGLGGTEAVCGFNAGFGNYFYDITRNGYRNISVLDVAVESNVNKSRVWLFRTDDITIQEAN
ncbi:sushi, nidogen and EGF-like domain-containing protein 1 [Exaiptasia diaphana]|uniref:NIDO domain-containing protein n=1 Tax=Exaiptasia diaphana TaxID=2652724 RepID=A0A913YFS9_EXADI|nr:sushi, nidogen and EGF-like domain-containing protein 1 [Exaiptasia diaphana]